MTDVNLYIVTGNIDQVQYCDKIKNIVDFLGTKLSVDELTKIWRMQVSVLYAFVMSWYSLKAVT